MTILKPEISASSTLYELFSNSVNHYGDNNFLGTIIDNSIVWESYDDIFARVQLFSAGLSFLADGKFPKVGLVEANSKYWVISAFATYSIGGVFIPMYPNELAINIGHIIKDSGINILIVNNDFKKAELESYFDDNITVITIRSTEYKNSFVFVEELGNQNPINYPEIAEGKIAEIIYTSGTTGSSKGVQLTHKNLVRNVLNSQKYWDTFDQNDRVLSILPWAHSYGQTCELHFLIIHGASIVINAHKETILNEIKIVKPTNILGVPKVFNKIRSFIIVEINKKPQIVRVLFKLGLYSYIQSQKSRVLFFRLSFAIIYRIIDVFIFKRIRSVFGGRLKALLCGSANLDPEVEYFFRAIKIPLYSGYGLTECSPVVSMNSPTQFKIGSVGLPLEGTKVRIQQNDCIDEIGIGEVEVFGDSIMVGYLNFRNEDSNYFTSDGFFKTGDIGRIDDDGFLYIVGRLKDNYKLSNGKYVVPNAIEESICMLPYIENAFVYGENKAYNICLVTLDYTVISRIAKIIDIKQDPGTIMHSSWLNEFITSEITKHLELLFNKYMLPLKILVLTENFTIENGLITTTQKIRRAAVLKKYSREIEELFVD